MVAAFGFSELFGDLAAEVPKGLDRTLCLRSNEPFELGENSFNGVQVGTVGWQVRHLGTDLFDCTANTDDLVTGEIVHDDKVAGTERREEVLFDPCFEQHAIDGPINNQRGGQSAHAKRGQERRGLPMAVRHMADQAFSFWRAAPRTRHVRFDPCFVDEHKALRVQVRLPDAPLGTSFCHVGTVLL